MLLSFFESFKYLGHIWPIALLRIFIGYIFLNAGLDKIQMNYLTEPILQETLYRWMSQGIDNSMYTKFLQYVVLNNWQVFSYLVTFGEIAVGLSFIIGFLVRPAALAAIFMNYNFMMAGGLEAQTVNQILIAVNLMLFSVSAGRSIGFDYYFFKKVRKIWW